MPVGVTEVADDTSEASSTSTHFKRKKARKNVVMGHRPVTRSQANSGNEEHDSNYSGSHNPLHSNSSSSPENDPQHDINAYELRSRSFEPSYAEQVLAANETRSVEQ